jgi:hypothetical protein
MLGKFGEIVVSSGRLRWMIVNCEGRSPLVALRMLSASSRELGGSHATVWQALNQWPNRQSF